MYARATHEEKDDDNDAGDNSKENLHEGKRCGARKRQPRKGKYDRVHQGGRQGQEQEQVERQAGNSLCRFSPKEHIRQEQQHQQPRGNPPRQLKQQHTAWQQLLLSSDVDQGVGPGLASSTTADGGAFGLALPLFGIIASIFVVVFFFMCGSSINPLRSPEQKTAKREGE